MSRSTQPRDRATQTIRADVAILALTLAREVLPVFARRIHWIPTLARRRLETCLGIYTVAIAEETTGTSFALGCACLSVEAILAKHAVSGTRFGNVARRAQLNCVGALAW